MPPQPTAFRCPEDGGRIPVVRFAVDDVRLPRPLRSTQLQFAWCRFCGLLFAFHPQGRGWESFASFSYDLDTREFGRWTAAPGVTTEQLETVWGALPMLSFRPEARA
jgi:hypothetical protein